jgi:tetratricopeptide (TPR) repeat protein
MAGHYEPYFVDNIPTLSVFGQALCPCWYCMKKIKKKIKKRPGENEIRSIAQGGPGNRFEEAESLYRKGLGFQEKGLFNEAIGCYRDAVTMSPGNPGAYYNLGTLFQEKGDLNEAIQNYQKVLQINPHHADTYNCLGSVFQEKQEYDEAIHCYNKAIELNPSFIKALINMANSFLEKEEFDNAVACYKRAIAIDPGFAGAYYNLGLLFHRTKQFNEAVSCYKKTIQLDPDFADAYFSLSLLYLLLGNFQEGWKFFEWRWRLKGAFRRNFSEPLWDGSDISKKRLLLHAEQGFGDTIQFARYIPFVTHYCSDIIVECQQELVSLFGNIEGVNAVIGHGNIIPGFDVHCPLLRLPLLFNTTPESIPKNVPYLSAGASLKEHWRAIVQDTSFLKRVGIVWSSGQGVIAKKKSIPLNMFLPLLRTDNSAFYSLQKGEAAKQAEDLPEGIRLIDFTGDLHNFADTAAFIESLDLVITVDTAVAHLAGALGKPVWTLLPFEPIWQWGLDREDSPWYPTMRLFRQPSRGDWASVIVRVRDEL